MSELIKNRRFIIQEKMSGIFDFPRQVVKLLLDLKLVLFLIHPLTLWLFLSRCTFCYKSFNLI